MKAQEQVDEEKAEDSAQNYIVLVSCVVIAFLVSGSVYFYFFGENDGGVEDTQQAVGPSIYSAMGVVSLF